VNKDFQYIGDA